MNSILENETIKNLYLELEKRVAEHILEPNNLIFLKKLLERAESEDEAINICRLGTTFYKTGLRYDVKMETPSDGCKFFVKNNNLSFDNGGIHHKLLVGDNYDSLLNLLVSHKKMVDVIYIDPPYGKDSLGEFAKMNYENSLNRDNLLSMMYARLQAAKQLMSDDGVIFCSIDDKNQAYMKCLFDDVFGESAFVTCIPRLTKAQRSGQEDYMDVSHDYILCYSYSDDFLNVTERVYDESKVKTDKNGKYLEGDTKAILAALSQGYSVGGDYDFEYNGKVYKPVTKDGVRNRWLWTKERMQAAADLGILVETNNSLRMQLYLDKRFEEKTNILVPKDDKLIFHTSDFMNSEYSNSNGVNNLMEVGAELSRSFDNPKPVALVKKLIEMHPNNKHAIVLDFFAGSGTTGQAVLEMNKSDGGDRQFILCTSNEITSKTPNGVVVDVTSKRLKRIMTGSCYDGNKDFKWNDQNMPFGNSLDVFNFKEDSIFDRKLFEDIDETLYGCVKFDNIKDKVEWVCSNFEKVARRLNDVTGN